MKKLTLGFLSIALLSLGACSTDVEDTTQSVRYTTVNLISPLDGSEPFATEGAYTFDLNLTRLYGTVSTTNLKIDNKDYSFTTDTVSTLNYTGMQGFYIRFLNVKGYLGGDRTMPLNNANFDITSLFYSPGITIPEYPEKQENMPYIIGQYTAGDWYVVTLQKDATYVGKTKTTYPGQDGTEQTYENEGMYYRVIMDTDKKTADIIIYEPQFASSAPKLKSIRLKGLPVKFGHGSFTIDAQDVIPQMVEGTSWIDVPNFTFNSFSVSSTNKEMTKIKMDYTVAGAYQGSFSGACVVELTNGGNQ